MILKCKEFICRIVGHDWEYFNYNVTTRVCSRCKLKEIYAHMNYKIGWKWIKV